MIVFAFPRDDDDERKSVRPKGRLESLRESIRAEQKTLLHAFDLRFANDTRGEAQAAKRLFDGESPCATSQIVKGRFTVCEDLRRT